MLVSLVLSFLILAINSDSLASTGEVIIPHASMSTSAIPLWVAQRQNFFGKYGVKSKVVWVRGNSAQIATLASGDAQIAYGGATTALAAAVGGKELQMIASLSSRENLDLVARPGINSPKDLRGSALVSKVSAAECGKPLRFGSSTSAWMRSVTTFK